MTSDHGRDLLTRLLHRIAPEIDLGTVRDGALLQDELDLDSMDFLTLVTAVHDETGIDIPESDYRRLATVGGFADYIGRASTGSERP